MSAVRILVGDALARLADLPDGSVHACVTSPPYWGLRDYGVEGQIGLEESPEAFTAILVGVFREVRRVLRPDGTLWLNLGDTYAGSQGAAGRQGQSGQMANRSIICAWQAAGAPRQPPARRRIDGIKPKDMVGIPWTVALALRSDGWWLRSEIIWEKPTCLPESVSDRPTRAHEQVFLLAPSGRYFYDAESVREPLANTDPKRWGKGSTCGRPEAADQADKVAAGGWAGLVRRPDPSGTRNMRTVLRFNPQPFGGAHFAVMPITLAERCIRAGTSEGGACSECGAPLVRIVEKGEPDEAARQACGADASGGYQGASTKDHKAAGVQDASAVKARILEGLRHRRTAGWEFSCDHEGAPTRPCVVLDPFGGAGTTALAAARLQRDAVLVELNPEYASMAKARIVEDAPLLNRVTLA